MSKSFSWEPENKVDPSKGKILLSEPFLDDPFFRRRVILLCEHNEEGSFGFVLNNYIDIDLDQIMEEMPFSDTRISLGGPVKNSNLYYIHTLGAKIKDSVAVVDGIYMGGDFDHLKELLSNGEVEKDEIRFFVGYSGWSSNQLENELDMKSWYVASPKSTDMLMNTEIDDLWAKVLKDLGGKYEMIANLPRDPSLN